MYSIILAHALILNSNTIPYFLVRSVEGTATDRACMESRRLLRRRCKTIWWKGARHLCEIIRESQAEEFARSVGIDKQMGMLGNTDGLHTYLAGRGGWARVSTSHAALALCLDKRANYETDEDDEEQTSYSQGHTAMLELMEVNAVMTLEDARTRQDPTSVAAVGAFWIDSVCGGIADKQRERFSAAARAHMEKTITKRKKEGQGAPAPCSLENALKGICCEKGTRARTRAFKDKRICLVGKMAEQPYKRTFKRVQTHNGGGPFYVFPHLLHK
jgi:hypothetical protein